jgi:hypothetical protein
MSADRGAVDRSLAPLLGTVREYAAEHAPEWFPDRPGAGGRIDLRVLSDRARCLLLAARLDDDSQPSIIVKVRRDAATERDGQYGSRPRLRSDVLPAADMSALEYAGLRAIAAGFGSDDPDFAAVRPLAHLPEQATIMMSFVAAPTLRHVILEQSRLRRAVRSRTPSRPAAYSCGLVGRWLRKFQGFTSTTVVPVQQGTRNDVVDQLFAYGRYLEAQPGGGGAADLADRAADLAGRVLPEVLPLALGHGDFAPRNMFVDRGRLVVFDPMPRWAVPAYDDVCRFLVGVRLLGEQVHTHGVAFSRATMNVWEDETISGFLGGDEHERAALRCYQLMILLDKWSALVDAPVHGLQGRVTRRSLQLASGFIRAEAERVLALAGLAHP